MPLDLRIQAFMEKAGLLVQAGSVPREPMVLLAEQRAAIEKAKPMATLASELEPGAIGHRRGPRFPRVRRIGEEEEAEKHQEQAAEDDGEHHRCAFVHADSSDPKPALTSRGTP